MKKSTLAVISVLSVVVVLHGQSYRGGLQKPEPRKKLVKVETYLCADTNGTDCTLSQTRFYNSRGYLIREKGVQNDFNENIHWERKIRNSANSRIESYTDDKGYHESGQFFFNSSGLIVKEIQSFPGNPDNVISYLYNDQDQLIRERECDEQGCVTDTIIYLTDQMHLVLRRNESNEYFDSTIYTYNNKGCMLTMDSYRPGGALYNIGRSDCDSTGKKLNDLWIYYRFNKDHYTQDDFAKDSIIYQYYPNGEMLTEEQWEYDRKELKTIITTKYNELGDPVQHIYNNHGFGISYVEEVRYYWR